MADKVAKIPERLELTLSALPAYRRVESPAEFVNQDNSFVQSQMTAEQRAIVIQRLAEPRCYAGEEETAALLRRFHPDRLRR